jgi:drug/metabolite transporter (DMT)-like permease
MGGSLSILYPCAHIAALPELSFGQFDHTSWRSEPMNPIKIVAVILIAVGILALVYGGFSYTKDSHDLNIGSLNLSVKEKERVNVPVWAGAGAIVAGAALLLFRGKLGRA